MGAARNDGARGGTGVNDPGRWPATASARTDRMTERLTLPSDTCMARSNARLAPDPEKTISDRASVPRRASQERGRVHWVPHGPRSQESREATAGCPWFLFGKSYSSSRRREFQEGLRTKPWAAGLKKRRFLVRGLFKLYSKIGQETGLCGVANGACRATGSLIGRISLRRPGVQRGPS